MSKVILVTGASSGLGRACALHLGQAGHRVYAASRRPPADLGPCLPLPLDVDQEASVAMAVQQIITDEKRLDVVMNCAGFGIAGAIEDTSSAEAKAQFETNFFGADRVIRAALPQLRKQQSGLILNVGSLVTQMPVPFQAYYGASKAALESYTESLRFELAPFGIGVACIEPGNFKTGFTAVRRRVSSWTAQSPYAERCQASVEWMEQDENNGLDPARFAEQVLCIVQTTNPRLRHLAIAPVERLGLLLRALLPAGLYEILFSRIFKAI